MHIRSINAGEIAEFTESDLYRKLSLYPITEYRALSQARNPRALPTDIVLIIAYSEEFELLGYIGALPDNIYINGEWKHIAWNSCWWSHPQKGKHTVMKLFAAMQKAWNYQMCFSDLDEKGKKFLEFTGKYHLIPYQGNRIIFRYYFSELIPAKFSILNRSFYKALLRRIDLLLNAINYYTRTQTKSSREVIKTIIYDPTKLPEKAGKLMENDIDNNISVRSIAEFQWIFENPWIVSNQQAKTKYSGTYFFSHTAETFHNYFIHFEEKQETSGLALIQERNGHYRIPYFFYKKEQLSKIGEELICHLQSVKALSLVTFHPELAAILGKNGRGIFKKHMVRYTAFPKEMEINTNLIYVQDGDGDAVFC